jgi:hypothetical protein
LFAGNSPQLITRGQADNQLYTVFVPGKRQPATKVRKHELPGPVVAAAHLSGRLVTLVVVGDELRVHVIGKKLGRLAHLAVPLATVGYPADAQLAPLYFHSGQLLVELSGTWWRLTPEASPREETIAAVGPGAEFDQPKIAMRGTLKISIDWRDRKAPRHAQVVFGQDELWAWSADETTWTVHSRNHVDREITVERGARVLGVHWHHTDPVLTTLSSGGMILRTVTPERSKTLTSWSNLAGPPALHPTRPYIALHRGPGAIDVCDLHTGETVLSLRGEP